MSIQDLKSIIPSYFKAWFLSPESFFEVRSGLKIQPDHEATKSLRVYKQFYR